MAVIAAALPVAGCSLVRRVATTPTTPNAHLAAPLEPVLPYLKSVNLPVYLPGWLPTVANGMYYLLRAQGTAESYEVSFNATNRQTPVNGNAPTAMAGMFGSIEGGPAGSLEANAHQPWMEPTTFLSHKTIASSIRLPDGRRATFYPDWGVRWTQGGWIYSVVGLGPLV
ncbi:MAG: hypothetical protein KGJ86_05350 [Chloroflexota bacterium]|nr:hypothetical protein [Chloroflexota bacterium]